MIYHLVLKSEWAKVKESYQPDSLKKEGFIHFSTREQVAGTYERFYKNQSMFLLHVDETILQHELKYEAADGDDYPHLYGPLNIDAIVKVEDYA